MNFRLALQRSDKETGSGGILHMKAMTGSGVCMCMSVCVHAHFHVWWCVGGLA